MCKLRRGLAQALILAAALLCGPATEAAEKVVVGMTGPPTALGWPFEIAIAKGFFTAEGITIDRVAAPSSAAVVLQLTAGALDLSVQGAFVDVIRAIEKGAPLAIVRIMVQTPPYELLAAKSIKSIKELKGKTISIGGQKDVTHVYLNRMLEPNGLKDSDVDLVYAGASSARFNALESGAVDAAMLTSPFNFKAADDGFPVVGRTADYITDLPQGGVTVNRDWAAGHIDTVRRFLAALQKGFDWFQDRRNRDEAITILAEAGKLKPEEVAKSYSFFRDGEFFEPTGNVAKTKLRTVTKVLQGLGDLPVNVDLDKMFLPGVTKVVD
jgi:ABC-type nitrate/sulfonate/bicarbonate transport system substrate-binding protein